MCFFTTFEFLTVKDGLTTGDVKVTGKIKGGYVRVKKGELKLKGILASDTRIAGRGELRGAGRISGDLKNLGDVAVGSFKKRLNVVKTFTNKGTVTLSLKNLSKFESIKAKLMKFGGKLIVVNDGSGLGDNEVVRLFKAKSYKGKFDSIKTVGFDNELIFDETEGTLTGTGNAAELVIKKKSKKSKKSSKSKAAARARSSAWALLAPTAATADPVESIQVIGGRKFRSLTIPRTPGLEVSSSAIQVSSDRVEWSSGKRHTTVLRDDAIALVVRDNTPVTRGNKRFIRLKR